MTQHSQPRFLIPVLECLLYHLFIMILIELVLGENAVECWNILLKQRLLIVAFRFRTLAPQFSNLAYSNLKMQFIKNAKLAGFSIAEIKQLIQFDSVKDRTTILALSEHKKKDLQIKIQELKSAMTFLQSLVQHPILDKLFCSRKWTSVFA